jgi:hypothetical protein
LEGTARNTIIETCEKYLQQLGKGRSALWAEFDNIPHTVTVGCTTSMKIKFNLVSMQFIHIACFEADSL